MSVFLVPTWHLSSIQLWDSRLIRPNRRPKERKLLCHGPLIKGDCVYYNSVYSTLCTVHTVHTDRETACTIQQCVQYAVYCYFFVLLFCLFQQLMLTLHSMHSLHTPPPPHEHWAESLRLFFYNFQFRLSLEPMLSGSWILDFLQTCLFGLKM